MNTQKRMPPLSKEALAATSLTGGIVNNGGRLGVPSEGPKVMLEQSQTLSSGRVHWP